MDDLLLQAAGGGDGLDLNIVCDDTVKHQIPTLKKKKKPTKRRNKYEKRREKSRQSKGIEQGEPIAVANCDANKDGGGNDNDNANVNTDENANEEKETSTVEEDGEAIVITDGNNEKADLAVQPQKNGKEDGRSDHSDNEDEAFETVAIEEEHNSDREETVRSVSLESSPELKSIKAETLISSVAAVPQALSRRVHNDIDLDNTEQRAQYMSEFHARPREMDRRSGAVSKIRPSRESTHIFQDIDDDDDNDTKNDDQDQNNATKKSPWEKCNIHPRLVAALSTSLKLQRPTVIQSRAISSLLLPSDTDTSKKRQNLFVQSETGSGKTLAYLIPILQSLAIDNKNGDLKKVDRNLGGTRCLILCPTRELASQTALAADTLCRAAFSWLVPGCLSGGEKRKSEKARIRKGITILVATPGRLLDHLQKTESLLMALKGKLEWLVIDEADRLLDMGLGHQTEQIVQHLRSNQPKSGLKRDGVTWRSILVSATVTNRVKDLSKSMLGGEDWVWARATKKHRKDADTQLNDQDKIEETGISSNSEGLHLSDSTPRQLTQCHMTVSAKLRLVTLIAFLVQRVKRNERTLVFMSTCDGVDYHHALFAAMDSILHTDNNSNDDDGSTPRGLFGGACPVHKLHGNVPHAERHTILKQFSKGVNKSYGDSGNERKAGLLLATDVAARGLNLPEVDWIVQYDPPCEVADYIHRAGRSARAGRAGHSLLFLLPSEQQFLEVLKVKGLNNMTAISLASTLNGAADICKDVATDGNKRSGGGYGHSEGARSGESFSSELQRRLEELVMEDDRKHKEAHKEMLKKNKTKRTARKHEVFGDLLEKARYAFQSYVRAYPTKEKAVRHIFSARAIHLGHIARSFALKEPPTKFINKTKKLEGEGSEGRKRSGTLAFGDTTSNTTFVKKGKSKSGGHKDDRLAGEDRINHTKRARTLLHERAAKLQKGGMDSF